MNKRIHVNMSLGIKHSVVHSFISHISLVLSRATDERGSNLQASEETDNYHPGSEGCSGRG